jgi:hypothetical protein
MKYTSSLILLAALIAGTSCAQQKYSGTKEEIAMYVALDDHATDVAQRYGMEVTSVGNTTDYEYVTYCVTMQSPQRVTLDEGRVLAANIVEEHLETIKTDPDIKLHGDPHISSRQIGYKIAFWDSKMNRPKRPFLAQIVYANRNLYYYYADPTYQALYLEHTEPFKDAINYRNSVR